MSKQGNLSRSVYSLPMVAFPMQNIQQPFTFESQSICSSSKRYNNNNDKDDDSENTQYRSYLQKDYKMRMQSLMKSYQLKISREQETFDLKQMNYVEQINNLKRQLKQNVNPVVRQNKIQINDHCSICSNGQIIEHMKNILQAVQKQHKTCLPQRTILNSKVTCLQQKISIFEMENEQIENNLRVSKQEIKNMRIQKQNWERQKRQKQKQIRELERMNQIKILQYQQEITKYKISVKQYQNQIKRINQNNLELNNEIKNLCYKVEQTHYTPINQYQQLNYETNYENNYHKNDRNSMKINQNYRNKYQQQALRPTSRTNINDIQSVSNSIHKKQHKLKQSNDYLQLKKHKNLQTKSSIYNQQEIFDTFRPSSKSYGLHKQLQGRNTTMAKYNYLG